MTTLIAGPTDRVSLPAELCARHGWQAETPVRVIETRHGVLLIPLTDLPMSDELKLELEDWQSHSGVALEAFPYEVEP